MANITQQNFTTYLNSSVGSRNKTYYAQGGFPSVDAFYGTYDSTDTAHKTLCAAYGDFDNIQSITGETKCSDIPRGFTVLVEDGYTVKEYQYKKLMPNGGYSASDLEPKVTENGGATDIVVNIPGENGAKLVSIVEAVEEFGSKIQLSEHRQYDLSKPNGLGYIVLKNDSFINGVFANVDEQEYTDYKSQHPDCCHEYLYNSEGVLTNTRITSLPTSGYDESSNGYNGYRLGHYYCVNTDQDVYQYYICRCPFLEQVVTINTIYEIRYDFDLCGLSINIPSGVQLHFCGGRIFNGIIVGDLTSIQAPPTKIFDNITIVGTWNVSQAFAEWFGAPAQGDANYDPNSDTPIIDSETSEIIGYSDTNEYDTPYIQKCLDVFNKVNLINKYLITTVEVAQYGIVENKDTVYIKKGGKGIWLEDSRTTFRGGFIYTYESATGVTIGTDDNSSKRRIILENVRIQIKPGQTNTDLSYGVHLLGNNKGYNTFLEIRSVNIYSIRHGFCGNIRSSLIDITVEQCGENVRIDGSINSIRIVGQASYVVDNYNHFMYLNGSNNVVLATIYDIGSVHNDLPYQLYAVWTNSAGNTIYGVSPYRVDSEVEGIWNRYKDTDFECFHIVPNYTYELEHCTRVSFAWRIIGDSSDVLDSKYTELEDTEGADPSMDELYASFENYFSSENNRYEGAISDLNEDSDLCVPAMEFKAIPFGSIVDLDGVEAITTGKWVAYVPVLTNPLEVNLFQPKHGASGYISLYPTTHTEIIGEEEKVVNDEGVLTINIGTVVDFIEFASYCVSTNYAFDKIELYSGDTLLETSLKGSSFRNNIAIKGQVSSNQYFERILNFKVKLYFTKLVRLKKLALYALTVPNPASHGDINSIPAFPNVMNEQLYLLENINQGNYRNTILTYLNNKWYLPNGYEWNGKIDDISRASFRKTITEAGEYKTLYFETNAVGSPKFSSVLMFIATADPSTYNWGIFRVSVTAAGGSGVRSINIQKIDGTIAGTFKAYYKYENNIAKIIVTCSTTRESGAIVYDLISSVSTNFANIKDSSQDYSLEGYLNITITCVNSQGKKSYYTGLSQEFKNNLEIGTKVYDTDNNCMLLWNGESWVNFDGIEANAYRKPSTGIPLSDLSSSVQTSLSKADTALQEHQSLVNYYNKTEIDTIVADNSISVDTKNTASALSINADKLTVINGAVGTCVITLQVPNDNKAHIWDIMMTTGSSVNITFEMSDNATILKPSGFSIGASKDVEISVIGVGNKYYLRYGEFAS